MFIVEKLKNSSCNCFVNTSRADIALQNQQLLFRGDSNNTNNNIKQPTSDMADVLLSLKHAVVHPGQSSSEKYDTQQQHYYHHPHQLLLSPTSTGGYSAGGNLCDQAFSQQAPTIFPSMSVNVSMNMTMHGYHPNGNYPSGEIPCQQVRDGKKIDLLDDFINCLNVRCNGALHLKEPLR